MNENKFVAWQKFKANLPHRHGEFSRRNWGDELHSLCSYQGKLKPSIAHHLIEAFTDEGDLVLDPFSGVGTIPLEAQLMNRRSLAFDLSEVAQALTIAKISLPSREAVNELIGVLQNYISEYKISEIEVLESKEFGFNGKLIEYFHPETLREIYATRSFLLQLDHTDPIRNMLASAVLHILHGNRPYALSRRSHPITPYAPTGDYEYKNLIEKVQQKIDKTYHNTKNKGFPRGEFCRRDSAEPWSIAAETIDAIITSPPFFDSTKFYMANWMRMWMMGWSREDFKSLPQFYLDERQKKSMDIYDIILQNSRKSLKKKGVLVMHIGKSHKMDMGKEILKLAVNYFDNFDLFDEDVSNNESHGIMDKGSVKAHQYLVLY